MGGLQKALGVNHEAILQIKSSKSKLTKTKSKTIYPRLVSKWSQFGLSPNEHDFKD